MTPLQRTGSLPATQCQEVGSWFDAAGHVEALRREAACWVGTPFLANSTTPGLHGGVSCQKLASELYRRTGCCDVIVPEVPMTHARFSRVSLVEEFMDRQPAFRRLWDWNVDALKPGDLLGFRIGRVVHHVGVCLATAPAPVFIHAMDHIGTRYSMLQDATWWCRLAAVWRPLPAV